MSKIVPYRGAPLVRRRDQTQAVTVATPPGQMAPEAVEAWAAARRDELEFKRERLAASERNAAAFRAHEAQYWAMARASVSAPATPSRAADASGDGDYGRSTFFICVAILAFLFVGAVVLYRQFAMAACVVALFAVVFAGLVHLTSTASKYGR